MLSPSQEVHRLPRLQGSSAVRLPRELRSTPDYEERNYHLRRRSRLQLAKVPHPLLVPDHGRAKLRLLQNSWNLYPVSV